MNTNTFYRSNGLTDLAICALVALPIAFSALHQSTDNKGMLIIALVLLAIVAAMRCIDISIAFVKRRRNMRAPNVLKFKRGVK
jgi:uncharacterized membrane protein